MKSLNGAELAGYIKENQARTVRSLRAEKIIPKLIIIRNSNNPVIEKYVQLKKQYGEDIDVEVEDWLSNDLKDDIARANGDKNVHGVIVQLPLDGDVGVDGIVNLIAPEKDVDGLGKNAKFDSATATAINWLLAGYNIDLNKEKIALVGHGRLINGPLEKMWTASGYDLTIFDKGDDLANLKNYSLIVTATGVPHLIKAEMLSPGAVVVDGGTTSEDGVLVGDVDDSVRERGDLTAITPKIGGVGPLTIATLFDHVLMAARNSKN